jgi:hypothetical protein
MLESLCRYDVNAFTSLPFGWPVMSTPHRRKFMLRVSVVGSKLHFGAIVEGQVKEIVLKVIV